MGNLTEILMNNRVCGVEILLSWFRRTPGGGRAIGGGPWCEYPGLGGHAAQQAARTGERVGRSVGLSVWRRVAAAVLVCVCRRPRRGRTTWSRADTTQPDMTAAIRKPLPISAQTDRPVFLPKNLYCNISPPTLLHLFLIYYSRLLILYYLYIDIYKIK